MIQPTKKQRELLTFIDNFTKGNGYSPSFREIMRALDYKSVSTVATHINGLIARGYLVKREHSARSLEVVFPGAPLSDKSTARSSVKKGDEPALVERCIRQKITELQKQDTPDQQQRIEVLNQALHILFKKA